MGKTYCPYVGALDAQDNPGPPIDYPSFENHCLAAESNDGLLLTDQATFCLTSSHRFCARYQAAAAVELDLDTAATPPREKTTEAGAPLTPPWSADLALEEVNEEGSNHKRLWGWVGAGIIFLTVLLCGAVFAAYTGWQMVNHSLLAQTTARVSTLNIQPTVAPPVYIVMTATSAPQLGNVVAPPAPVNGTEANGTPVVAVLPVAVTPTPVIVTGQQVQGEGQAVEAASPTADDGQPTLAPTLPPAAPDQATPPVNLQVEVPTRRSTPIFDLPTSTPDANVAPPTVLPTPTVTPPRGTPVVQFSALEQQIMIRTCTGVRWHVENVQSVYYENQPVSGDGTQEECIKEHPKTYKLAVILYDGSTHVYSTTIVPLFPTDTPEPTASFTPESIPTPTWTPLPATATPTPNVHYATTVAIDGGDHHSCSAGGNCEIGVLVTNSGDTSDNISVGVVKSGAWSPKLCRMDGVCSDNSLPLNGMGPGNTAYVKLVLTIAGDAAGQTAQYAVRAVSNGSNGMVMSDVANVTVEVK
ncbi:MAG: hypothetical protein U0350_38385 [Caldilineaceae bacterium]